MPRCEFAFGDNEFSIDGWIRTNEPSADTQHRRIFMLDGPTGDNSDNVSLAIENSGSKFKTIDNNDNLTGLTNKALFHDRLDQAIHNAERKDEVLAVLFIDLDNFKYVNDSMGHSIGDKLLKIIGNKFTFLLFNKFSKVEPDI